MRGGYSKLLKVANPLKMQIVNRGNFVTSEVLEQLDRHCITSCNFPRIPARKVTVVGAGSDIGRVVCLFLKQQPVIKQLAMYDEEPANNVLGAATDIAHIDTSTALKAYQGHYYLKEALRDSDVVLVCGGFYMLPPECSSKDFEVFLQNMHLVRTTSLASAHVCPKAVIAIQTPPVDCNFALAMHTLKAAGTYDKQRLLGVNAINSMRANQLFCSITGLDPSSHITPVVCGTGRCTRVPVFSAGKATNFPQTQAECLTRLVREADEIICKVKGNCEQGHLSIGFATARFVTNIMKGLFDGTGFIDSALVEQSDPDKCYRMNVCATPVTMGKDGIVEYRVPVLNETENKLLEKSKCHLEDLINLGRCYAVGEEYKVLPCRQMPTCPHVPYCPCFTCEPTEEEKRLKEIKRP